MAKLNITAWPRLNSATTRPTSPAGLFMRGALPATPQAYLRHVGGGRRWLLTHAGLAAIRKPVAITTSGVTTEKHSASDTFVLRFVYAS